MIILNIKVSSVFTNDTKDENFIYYNDLNTALKNVKEYDTIYLLNEEYFGKFYLDTPNITIIGDNSVIAYDAYHAMIKRKCDGGDGVKTYGTTGSASLTILENAKNLVMKNVTVKNLFNGEIKKGRQAVAFKTEADNGTYLDCKFNSNQDTLYVEGIDNYFYNCEISGDVDFIFGSGKAIFDKCLIYPTFSNKEKSYISAPNSFYDLGLLFYRCKVFGDNLEIYLGRPWFPSGAKQQVMPKALFYQCEMNDKINMCYKKMHDSDPDYHECYYYECNNKSNAPRYIVEEYLKYYQEKVNK